MLLVSDAVRPWKTRPPSVYTSKSSARSYLVPGSPSLGALRPLPARSPHSANRGVSVFAPPPLLGNTSRRRRLAGSGLVNSAAIHASSGIYRISLPNITGSRSMYATRRLPVGSGRLEGRHTAHGSLADMHPPQFQCTHRDDPRTRWCGPWRPFPRKLRPVDTAAMRPPSKRRLRAG